jgi:ATP-binding cassette subfamily B protein
MNFISALIHEITHFRASLALYIRLLPYVGAEWHLLLCTVTAMLAATLLTLLQPWPMQVIVDSVLGSQPVPAWITIPVGQPERLTLLVVAIGLLVTLLLTRQAVGVCQGYFSQVLGQRMVFELRSDLYAKLQRLSLRFHDRSTVGDLMYRITEDAAALQDIVTYGIVPLAIQFVTVIAIGGTILLMNLRLGIVALMIVPFLLFWTVWFSERVKQGSRHLASAESGLYTSVNEALGSIRAVKSFTTEALELERFENRARVSQEAYVRLATLSSAGGFVTEIIVGVGAAIVMFLGALSVLDGNLTLGQLLVFVAYLQSLYGPVTQLSGSALVIQRSGASIERVLEIFDAEDEHVKSSGATLKTVSGHIVYDDVTFAYDEGRQTIDNVSFEVLPGEIVAFVGPSGAGKTTLLSLLLRFYQVHSGQIRLDGVDIASLDLLWLRQQIALVLQEPIILSCSLGENIAYGRPGSSHDDVIAASQAAGLHEFIMQLPNRYDTCVGERGVRLSGGQRQRLSIARAFLKDAPILILDEPTSNLDTTTEQYIFQALEPMVRGRVMLVIAHRLSTVQRADRIVVLDQGRVVEHGTHTTLLGSGGLYARLHDDHSVGWSRAGRSLHPRISIHPLQGRS